MLAQTKVWRLNRLRKIIGSESQNILNPSRAASAKFAEEKIASTKGNRSPLKLMKREFTYQEFAEVCQNMGYKNPMNIIYKYKHRGVIVENDKVYIINPEYAESVGIA